jgi:diguanylate cyclase (GGDEF)-like protein
MDSDHRGTRRTAGSLRPKSTGRRSSIRRKFFLIPITSAICIFAVGGIGFVGLAATVRETQRIYEDNVQTAQLTTSLHTSLDDAGEVIFRLIPTKNERIRRSLIAQLRLKIAPHVQGEIQALRLLHDHDPAIEQHRVERIQAGWQRFMLLIRSKALLHVEHGKATFRYDDALARKAGSLLEPLTTRASRMTDVEASHAESARTRAVEVFQRARQHLVLVGLAGLLLSLGVAAILIRNVVPRLLEYSRFARRVARGEGNERLIPKGSDEITDLGQALDEMVVHNKERSIYRETQQEFADTIQLTEDEPEAYALLKRHLERNLAGSSVTVLRSNNSDSRLEPATTVQEDSTLNKTLLSAVPRSCLAVRFGRPHQEGYGHQPLMSCDVCSQSCGTTCEPLLVAGQVIGSVLVNRAEDLNEGDRNRLKQSVSEAAPVLANLRNLAMAEVRAGTDSLTGLPNNRSAQDNLKRMVAQASRSLTPLAAVLLDLDRFKEINDTFGHGRGDDVLAIIGATLRSITRTSDFASRYGGEEFLILLPETHRVGAVAICERIRQAISDSVIPGLERKISASLGVAVLPDDAYDADMLMRNADRALYTAKSNGRNRVEAFTETAATKLETEIAALQTTVGGDRLPGPDPQEVRP